MALIFWRKADGVKEKETSEENPFPVSIILGDPEGGAVEYLGDAPMPAVILNTPTVAPAARMVNLSFIAPAAGDYTAADVVSFSTAATNNGNWLNGIAAPGGVAILDSVVARCSEDSVLWRLRLHFYRTNPMTADVELRDNVAADWAKTAYGMTNYIDYVDMPAMADRGTAMAQATASNLRKLLGLATGQAGLYFVVETLDAEANETAGMTLSFDFYFLD